MDANLLNILGDYGPVGIMMMFLIWKSKQMEKRHDEAINR